MPLLYRWLHPISIPELYDLYQTHHQGNDGVASVSVFRSEFKKWKPVLQIRQLGQHARCMTCALNANQGHLTLCCQVAMFFLDEQSIIMDSMFHHLLALSYHQKPVCVHTDQNM